MDVASLLVLLANLAVLGLNLKLYTEILKDKSQDKRAEKRATPPARVPDRSWGSGWMPSDRDPFK